ncbi:hypothetical protein P2G88_01125 [Aliiglaciecola sp. CAU 1673]|uniref:hypothetical protein n=1 Tax=Aliiglaciecola sp. CAU 1673 TaxID=3032595 RepID=UPI0023DC47E2|nr:hypothetical protein [Aliiglaciecola sp. CAU 1673]MDF2176852.1 hypothetical protein [Aliiglaciecola sp. CAU 1673]
MTIMILGRDIVGKIASRGVNGTCGFAVYPGTNVHRIGVVRVNGRACYHGLPLLYWWVTLGRLSAIAAKLGA